MQLGKDVSKFTPDELDALVASHKSPSLITVRVVVSVYNKYIVWLMTQGMVESNPLDHLMPLENWPHKHVVPSIWITDADLDHITDFCENAQDAVIFQLLFEGVSGKAMQEIINLTIDDVDFENRILTLREGSRVRSLDVSEKLIKLIQNAHAEHVYYVRNKQSSTSNLLTYNLIPSRHVVKSCRIGAAVDPKITKKSIWTRVNTICELIGLKNITTKNIIQSGMLFAAKELCEQSGILTNDMYKVVAKRFSHNFWRVLQNLITPEIIESVYGVKCNG